MGGDPTWSASAKQRLTLLDKRLGPEPTASKAKPGSKAKKGAKKKPKGKAKAKAKGKAKKQAAPSPAQGGQP
jgi:hypothetical protein